MLHCLYLTDFVKGDKKSVRPLKVALLLFMALLWQVAMPQCSCTSNRNNNNNFTVGAGQVYCLNYSPYTGTITLNGGTLCISSGVTCNATYTFSAASTIVNSGTLGTALTLGNGYSLTNNSGATVSGALTLNTGCTVSNNGTISGSITQNGGNLTVTSGGQFGPTSFTASGGTLTNNSGGTVTFPASQTIAGSYTFTSSGTANISNLSINPGGSVTLNGGGTISGTVLNRGSLSLNGSYTLSGAFTQTGSGTSNMTGTVSIHSNTINNGLINLSGSLNITGNYADSSGASIKASAAGNCNLVTISGTNSTGSGTFNGNSYGMTVSPVPTPSSRLSGGATGPFTAPAVQGSAFSASISGLSVSGSFTSPGGVSGFVVLRYIGLAAPSDNPVNNTAYTAGSTVGSCTVAAVIAGSSSGTKNFTDMVPQSGCGNSIYYRIFSYSGSLPCELFDLSTPLTGSLAMTATSASVSAAGPTTFCRGGSVTLTASGGGTYNWSSGPSTAAIAVSPSSTTSYTVTVTGSNGCTATAGTTVTVNPLPVPSVNNASICSGAAATLTASGGSSYLWSTGAATASISVSTAGTYSVTATSAAGCTATASGTATAHSSPSISASSNTPVCTGSSILLASSAVGSSPFSYSWSGPASFSSTSASATVANANTINGGTYTVSVTDANSCTASQGITVVMDSNCVDSTTVGVNGGNSSDAPCTQILRFDHYNDVVASSSGGQNHTWVLLNGNILTMNIRRLSTGGGFTAVTAPTWSGAAFGQSGYTGLSGKTVLYTSTNGEYGKLFFTNIQLHDSLGHKITNYTLIGIDGESTDNAERDTIISNGTTWFDYDTITPPSVGSVPTETGIGTSTLVWTGNGPANARSRLVSTNQATSFTFSTQAGGLQGFAMGLSNPVVVDDTFKICSGTAFNAKPGNLPTGTTYTWGAPIVTPAGSLTGDSAKTVPTNTPGQTLVNTGNVVATAVYTILPSNNCSGLGYTVTVLVNPVPKATITPNIPQCSGNPMTVTATPVNSGSYTYNWSGPGLSGINTLSFSIEPVSSLNSGTYSLTLTDQSLCTGSSSANISVVTCLSVSGAVFDDGNGNGLIDGTDAEGTHGKTLYSILSDSSGRVIATDTIAASGLFSLGQVLPNTSGYQIAVSTAQPAIGSAAPGYLWPSGWVGTKAQYGLNNLMGSGVLGTGSELVPFAFGTSNISNVLIGYDQLPGSNAQSYFIPYPGINAVKSLTAAGGLGPLAGSDPEDGGIGSSGTFVITSLAGMNGNALFYDAAGTGVLAPYDQISGYTVITNYIPGRLYIKFIGSGSVSAGFNFGTIDNAGQVDPSPVPYYVSWPTPLPVNLLALTATPFDAMCLLQWSTASETDNNYFEAERSPDGLQWQAIGRVPGAGTSPDSHFYSLQDNSPLPGTNYYRLKQVDFDGQFIYSPLAEAFFAGNLRDEPQLSCSPNPADRNGSLLIRIAGDDKLVHVAVTDLSGEVLRESDVPAGTTYELASTGLAEGLYIVTVRTAAGMKLTRRLSIK